ESAAIAAAVNTFLNDDLLRAVDPSNARGRDVRVSEILDRAAAQAAVTFRGRPRVEAAVRTTIGGTYRRLGRLNESRGQLERAYALLRDDAGAPREQYLEMLRELGVVYDELGRREEAASALSGVVTGLTKLVGERAPQTLLAMDDLGQVLTRLGR